MNPNSNAMNLEDFYKKCNLVAFNFGFNIENKDYLKMLAKEARCFKQADVDHAFDEMLKLNHVDLYTEYKIPFHKPFPISLWINFFSIKQKERAKRVIELRIENEEIERRVGAKTSNPVSADKIKSFLEEFNKSFVKY